MRALALIHVAGHQHDCGVGVMPTRRESEFDPVHPRHLYVTQKQIDSAIGRIERVKGAGAVCGFDEVVTIATKGAHKERLRQLEF